MQHTQKKPAPQAETHSYREVEKALRRGPQIITRKDAAIIAAEVGLLPGWKCLDLGGGSGFLALFLARFLTSGSVTVYEIRKEHAAIITENVKKAGFANVAVINRPAGKFAGKNYDLITMDMKGAEKVIPKAHAALKRRGWLVIYSPHIEQQLRARKALEKAGFRNIYSLETIQRRWQIDTHGYAHPEHTQLVHTGFLTIARKE